MNTKILAGLVTAVLTSGAAMAQEVETDVNQGHEQGAPADMGIGGAGDTTLQQQGFGGSGRWRRLPRSNLRLRPRLRILKSSRARVG
ncbi:hypothetical protein ACN28S_53275 [Cystobacter fuscus]